MKKIICIVCCLLCIVMSCTACSKADVISVGDYCNSIQYSEDLFSPKKLERAVSIKNLSYVSSKTTGYLVVLSDVENNEWKVYNAKTNKAFLSFDKSDVQDISTVDVYDVPFLLVQTEDDGKTNTTVYDALGNVVLKKASAITPGSFELGYEELNLFTIDGSVYRLNGETASLVVNNQFFGDIPDFDYATESYYYDISSDSVTVYNYNLEVVFFWESPYAEGSNSGQISLLDGEKLLFQMVRPLPFTEKKYDFSSYNQKYDLVSIMIDVNTGKEKELKLDYIVTDVEYFASDIENEYTVDGVQNLVTISKIEDKQLLQETLVSISSKKAKIEAEVFTDAKNCESITPFAEDRFIMTCKNGEEYLLDKNGNKIGRFDDNYDGSNNKYLAKDGILYDFNLNPVYNYAEDGKSLVKWMNHTVIFSEYDSEAYKTYYYLYTEGSEPEKISGTLDEVTREFYITGSISGEFQLYDEYGTEIGDAMEASSIEIISTCEDCVIIVTVNEENKVNYYVISE